jgi:pyrimidine operon attenuation protein/uracil phosphoribosyltransferase
MKRRDKETVMDEETMERALTRITHEILERNQGVKDLALIGIRTGGVYLAERIRDKIEQMERVRVPSGIIDITLYRDDFAIGLPRPLVGKTEIPFSLKEKKVILVDDILRTGKKLTEMRALLEANGAQVLALAVIVYQPTPRTPDFSPLPLYYLARLEASYYRDASSCELCRQGVPLEMVRV